MQAYIIEKAALEKNVQILLQKAAGKTVWGVVKGNGYGLGAGAFAQLLADYGIYHFAVTALAEARALYGVGLSPILMLRGTNDEAELDELMDMEVICTIGSWADAQAIDRVAARRGAVAKAHLKIDTGMGRYGFLPEEADRAAAVYATFPHIAVTGVYTHFHTAGNRQVTQQQYAAFQQVLTYLRAQGCETGMVHCCNSLAFWHYPQMHCDAVRLGSALLGRVGYAQQAGLTRLGYVQAEVEELRRLPKGHNVGYGGDCKLKRNTVIAIVGVGYFHGFAVERGYDVFRPRDCLRSMGRYLKYMLHRRRLTVTIAGQQCPVLGHVGMVNLVADVTGVACKLHDPVIVQVNPLDLKGIDVTFV